MNTTCNTPPADKKAYITDIGKTLVKRYGKKKFYKPKEVKRASKESPWADYDYACWGMSIFTSREDFKSYHDSAGETCDYTEMRTTMLSDIAREDIKWIDMPEIELDSSWLDFDSIIDSIGNFFSGIFNSDNDIDLDWDD